MYIYIYVISLQKKSYIRDSNDQFYFILSQIFQILVPKFCWKVTRSDEIFLLTDFDAFFKITPAKVND